MAKLAAQHALARAVAFQERTAAMEIPALQSDSQRGTVVRLIRSADQLITAMEDERKAQVAPIKKRAKAIDDQYREPRRQLERIRDAMRQRLSEYATAQARQNSEAVLAAVNGAGAAALSQTVLDAEPLQGVSDYVTWEVASVDVGQVPHEFLTLADKRVSAFVQNCRREGIEPSIPGIRFEKIVKQRIRKT